MHILHWTKVYYGNIFRFNMVLIFGDDLMTLRLVRFSLFIVGEVLLNRNGNEFVQFIGQMDTQRLRYIYNV